MKHLISLSILLIVFSVSITSCGSSDSSSVKTAVDSVSARGPAPDNNSANNPSSADTSYQKDTGRKVIDSTRKR